MKRALNLKNLKSLTVLLALLLTTTWVAPAQNLITNGDFEQTSGFDYQAISDYQRIWGGGVQEGQFIHDATSNGHGVGTIGWPSNMTAYSGSYYLLFNGFGGSQNPTKAAWKQTITSITPNTTYTFSAQVRNLAQGYMGMNPNPAVLRLKINNQPVAGSDLTLPTHNNWTTWTVTWNSGSATQAFIEIVDTYTGQSSQGDDFGLDYLSFTPDAVYSVTANNDTWPLACIWTPVEIPVLDNDIISPGIQNVTVQILTQPAHGEATVLSNKKIEYIFNDATFSGTDQIKYRVGFTAQGIFDEAWVYITVGQTPVVGNISAPGPICAGGVLGISVPTVNPSATGQWEYSSSQTGTFQTFDPNNIPLSMNGKWVRYSATNDCGTGNSNAVQITVTNGPNFTGQTPQIQPICAGQSLSLTAPTYNTNGSQILNQGWVASPTENGDYTAFSLNNIPASYNGWYIRYMVEGSCGPVLSPPAQLLTVNVPPSNVATLVAPNAICAGDDLDVTAPTYDGTGTGTWEICQTQNGTYQSFSILNVPRTYDGWYLHYKVSNSCGSVTSNAVQIHVNAAPTIATPATPTAICAGGSFNLSTPTIQNNGFTITDQGWQIAATQNGTYNTFNNNNVQYSSNGYWIRYYAVNECGETHSASVQITVNDEPIVGNITAPAGICAGGSFNLTAPQVQWRHTNQGTGSWEIAPTSSGDFTALNNNNIPFSYNGYYIRYKAVNGCGTSYSTNVVQVTVYSTEPTYDTITACDTYVWNGVTCNSTGNYQATVQNANGCTITAHLHFIMSDAYTETQVVSRCNSYTWPKNGVTYNSSGTYEYTIESGNPLVCDSIFTLNLTINNAPQILGNISAPSATCAGSPISIAAPQYVMNHAEGGDAHWEYATSANGPFTPFDPSANNLGYGTYYLRYAVSNECDDAHSNVVSFHINDVPEANMHLSAIQVCEGELLTLPEINVNWHNDNENDRIAQWQMSPTQNGTFAPIDPTMSMQSNYSGYWLRFIAQNSCGTDVVGPVMITVLTTEDQLLDTITECDAYVLESGQVITESTTIDYEVFEPCYHLVHQPIVINHSDYVVVPITSCHDEFEWHGMTFYRSEQTQYASVSLTNIYNCDSVVELQLDFGDYAKVTEQKTACDFYEWPRKPGSYYTESQMDSLFIQGNDVICDSMIYLNLTIGQTYELQGEPMTECSGFVWHGVPYYADAIIYDSLKTFVTRCDSIITYQLTIIPPIEKDTSLVSCQPFWWQCQGQSHYFEEDGDEFTAVLTSSVTGCDSIVTLHFSLSESLVREYDTLACQTFNWYGHSCDGDGEYTHTFQTSQGCDSIVTMHLHMNVTQMSTQFVSACDSVLIQGTWYNQVGNYYIYLDTIQTQNGCDSLIHRIDLTVLNSDQMAQIEGSHDVYVASNLISGIYRYDIDTTGIVGDITWSLTNPEWRVLDNDATSCRVLVTTPGSAILKANFRVADCGEMERQFFINAGFFGVDEHQGIEAHIYPNPTKGMVTVEALGIEQIRIVNMMGQVLDVVEGLNQDQVEVNLSRYVPSVYLIEIKTMNGMAKKRVVYCK